MRIPLALGGIALAAVGYGLKEYCESEGCFSDETLEIKSSTPSEDIFTTIEGKKRTLYEVLLLQLKVYLLATAPKKKENLTELDSVSYEHFLSSQMPEDVALYAKQYVELIENILQKVIAVSECLAMIKEKKISYKRLTKEDKQYVKNGYKLFNLSCKVLSLRLLDGEVLNIEAIALLKEFQTELQILEVKKD